MFNSVKDMAEQLNNLSFTNKHFLCDAIENWFLDEVLKWDVKGSTSYIIYSHDFKYKAVEVFDHHAYYAGTNDQVGDMDIKAPTYMVDDVDRYLKRIALGEMGWAEVTA